MQGKLSTFSTMSDSQVAAEAILTVQMQDGAPNSIALAETWPADFAMASGEIWAICACDSFLLVAQQHSSSNTSLSRVSLPDMQLQSTKKFTAAVSRMWLNCDATRVALVDMQVRTY